jgi:hypothetical protein
VVAAAVLLSTNPRIEREMERNRAIAATRPTVDAVLSCGRLGATRKTVARGVVPQLAALSRRSLSAFGVYRPGRPFAAVIQFTLRTPPGNPRLPAWRKRETPLGPLFVASSCHALD